MLRNEGMGKRTDEVLLPSWLFAIGVMVILTVLSGIILRFLYITPINGLSFTHMMHAHSHLAILGWVYLAIIALFYLLFIGANDRTKTASFIFMLTAVITVCMFIAFIFQGYALYSIVFSSLHIIVTYAFFIYFCKLIKQTNEKLLRSTPGLFVKGSIFFLIVGSFGPWILAYWNGAVLPKNFIYDVLVHTFLHFQINGWITIAIIGILLFLIEKEGMILSDKFLRYGFWLYTISLVPSIILNVDWTQATMALLPLALIGWLMKFIGIVLIVIGIVKSMKDANIFSRWGKLFMLLALVALVGKTFFEVGNTIPVLIEFSMYSRNIVIGYLHLGLIGFASFALLAFFIKLNWIHEPRSYVYYLIISGFVLYELLLFGDGVLSEVMKKPTPNIHILLFIVTLILSAGVLLLIFNKKSHIEK